MKEIIWIHLLLAFIVLFLIFVALLVSVQRVDTVARMRLEEYHDTDFDQYVFMMPDGETFIPTVHFKQEVAC